MVDDQIKKQLTKFKAEQKAKSKRNGMFQSFYEVNTKKFEDKLTAIRVTQKANESLFTSAIKKLMKD